MTSAVSWPPFRYSDVDVSSTNPDTKPTSQSLAISGMALRRPERCPSLRDDVIVTSGPSVSCESGHRMSIATADTLSNPTAPPWRGSLLADNTRRVTWSTQTSIHAANTSPSAHVLRKPAPAFRQTHAHILASRLQQVENHQTPTISKLPRVTEEQAVTSTNESTVNESRGDQKTKMEANGRALYKTPEKQTADTRKLAASDLRIQRLMGRIDEVESLLQRKNMIKELFQDGVVVFTPSDNKFTPSQTSRTSSSLHQDGSSLFAGKDCKPSRPADVATGEAKMERGVVELQSHDRGWNVGTNVARYVDSRVEESSQRYDYAEETEVATNSSRNVNWGVAQLKTEPVTSQAVDANHESPSCKRQLVERRALLSSSLERRPYRHVSGAYCATSLSVCRPYIIVTSRRESSSSIAAVASTSTQLVCPLDDVVSEPGDRSDSRGRTSPNNRRSSSEPKRSINNFHRKSVHFAAAAKSQDYTTTRRWTTMLGNSCRAGMNDKTTSGHSVRSILKHHQPESKLQQLHILKRQVVPCRDITK